MGEDSSDRRRRTAQLVAAVSVLSVSLGLASEGGAIGVTKWANAAPSEPAHQMTGKRSHKPVKAYASRKLPGRIHSTKISMDKLSRGSLNFGKVGFDKGPGASANAGKVNSGKTAHTIKLTNAIKSPTEQ
ncbi:MAG: hypothetical protein ACHP7N_12740 [Caulobacterales bacterium]